MYRYLNEIIISMLIYFKYFLFIGKKLTTKHFGVYFKVHTIVHVIIFLLSGGRTESFLLNYSWESKFLHLLKICLMYYLSYRNEQSMKVSCIPPFPLFNTYIWYALRTTTHVITTICNRIL